MADSPSDPHPSVRAAAETVSLEPTLFVLFGATGDLAKRKLMPAIHQLMERRGFDDDTVILGVATSRLSDEDFRRLAADALNEAGIEDSDVGEWCERRLYYQSLEEGFDALAKRIADIEEQEKLVGNRVFYLAIPPAVFDDTISGLGDSMLIESEGWTRLVIEKPFGTDRESAEELNALLHRSFDESQVYRIDHYLAKETVQNLLVFRFANPIFEQSWNRDRIDSIQITVAETLGLEGRIRYFEKAGLIRDIVQNHLLQVLTLVAMEPPVRLTADAIRDEKVKVLKSIYPVHDSSVVRGRYTAGVIDGEQVPGYLEEPGIEETSTTETYAAMTLEIDNWRWRGVPFHVRSGKRMATTLTEVAVRFREPPVCLFEESGECEMHSNTLYITLQPNEGFELVFDVKTPGEEMELQPERLRFHYGDVFGHLPDAYETLLADVMAGDQTLFVRADEAEEAWRILEPILDEDERPEPYPAGSWGPQAANELVARRGDRWTTHGGTE